jgi:hypothetical protein
MLLAQVAPSFDLGAIAKALLSAVKSGDWVAVVAAVLVLVVAAIRLYGQKIRGELPDENFLDKALTWLLESKPGGWTLNVLTAIAGAYATALLAREPITWALTQAALLTALSGAALWELAKDILGWWAAKKALEAGEAAKAKIQTSGDAVNAVNERTDTKPF